MAEPTSTTRGLAIYGGSFDPPHVGHVLAAHYVLLTAPVSRVLVVPCAQHPFGKSHCAFEHRLAMCRHAFAYLGDAVEVLDIEGHRSGPSYTVDTVREIAARYPGVPLELVVGSDIPPEMEKWKDADALRALVRVRVLTRFEEAVANASGASPDSEPVSFYLPKISGTTIRQLVRTGGDLAPHVPAAVCRYIEEQGLYRLDSSE
jgi:nicotinate-nucleotide adenylyltransferase